MGVNYDVLSQDEEKAAKQIEKAIAVMKATNEVYALVIEKAHSRIISCRM